MEKQLQSPTLRKIEQAAAPLIAKGMTKEQATTQVLRNNPALYGEHIAEKQSTPRSAAAKRIDQAAAPLIAQGKSKAQAIAQVLRADPALYEQYMSENPAQTGGPR